MFNWMSVVLVELQIVVELTIGMNVDAKKKHSCQIKEEKLIYNI